MAASKTGPGFHHIAIRAHDFDKTLEFYIKGLGMTRHFGWGNAEEKNRAAMLDLGCGDYIEVFEGRTEDAAEGGILHYALRVQSADEAYHNALDAGAAVSSEPNTITIKGDRPVDVRIAFVKGLDGEVIEFFENEEL